MVSLVEHGPAGVRVTAGDLSVTARRAIITAPPVLAERIRYAPALPAVRDHLSQRTPMRWLIKVHCVYPTRFWLEDGLSGLVQRRGRGAPVCRQLTCVGRTGHPRRVHRGRRGATVGDHDP